MATYFLFRFVLLSSYFLLLLSATSDSEYDCLIGKNTRCGYLGEISFPFTTVDNKECGLYIRGCDNNNPLINLRNQIYIIDYINYKKNSVIIYGHQNSSGLFDVEQMNTTAAFSFNRVDFKVCSHGYDKSHENMSKYRNCPNYDIYFTSKSDRPIFPLPCLPYIPPHKDCVKLISLLEIKVDLESCDCYRAGKSCLPDQDTLNFKCGRDLWYEAPPPHSEDHSDNHPKGNQQHLKVAIIGLSIGLTTMIVIVLFVIIFLLYYRRIKSSGVKNQSRANYRGLSRNTTPESGAVYFGIPVFSYEELQEATDNFNQARELGEGGFGTVYYGERLIISSSTLFSLKDYTSF